MGMPWERRTGPHTLMLPADATTKILVIQTTSPRGAQQAQPLTLCCWLTILLQKDDGGTGGALHLPHQTSVHAAPLQRSAQPAWGQFSNDRWHSGRAAQSGRSDGTAAVAAEAHICACASRPTCATSWVGQPRRAAAAAWLPPCADRESQPQAFEGRQRRRWRRRGGGGVSAPHLASRVHRHALRRQGLPSTRHPQQLIHKVGIHAARHRDVGCHGLRSQRLTV